MAKTPEVDDADLDEIRRLLDDLTDKITVLRRKLEDLEKRRGKST